MYRISSATITFKNTLPFPPTNKWIDRPTYPSSNFLIRKLYEQATSTFFEYAKVKRKMEWYSCSLMDLIELVKRIFHDISFGSYFIKMKSPRQFYFVQVHQIGIYAILERSISSEMFLNIWGHHKVLIFLIVRMHGLFVIRVVFLVVMYL